jgi:hypothetical protein
MAGERTFVVKFLSDTDNATRGFGKLTSGLKGIDKATGGLIPGFSNIGLAATAAFGAVAAGLTIAAKAAIEDEKSQALLQRQLEKTFGANEELTTSAERYISVTQLRTGTSDVELRDSLSTLVRATGDLTKSQDLLNTAQDISAATGRDLGSVTLALAKASQGQFTALSRLGIPLDDSTKKSKDFGKVLETLEGQFGGAADAAANTFGGKLKIIQGQFGEIIETIGAALLPYLDKFATFLVKNVAPAVQRITTVISEKGLIAGFQQLVFESGSAAPKIINAFKAITLGIAGAANVAARSFYILKANFQFLTGSPLDAVKTFAKAFDEFIDIGKLEAQFDGFARAVDNYAVRGVPSAIRAQQGLTGAIEDLSGDDGGGGGGLTKASKTLKTAAEKLKLYTDALKSTSSAQKSLTNAQNDSRKAGESLATANTNLADAQNAFNAAVAGYGADSPQARKASKDLELAQRGLERAGYRVEQSVFAIRDAEKNLADVRKDPESTPQAIREAEIALAEAKLSSADAVDEQTRATDDLTQSQDLLNQAVTGATIGSALYTSVSDALADAKIRQKEASDANADAIIREAEAQERYNDAVAKSGEIAKLYPKIAAGVPNPMGVSSDVPVAVRGNPFTGTFPQNSGQTIINVNAGLVSSPDQVAQEIQDILNRRARNNGGNPFTGTFG